MNAPSMHIPSHDGDVAANPPGFDRDAFLKQLAVEITAFFEKTPPLARTLDVASTMSAIHPCEVPLNTAWWQKVSIWMPTHWDVDGLDAMTWQASLIMWNSANRALNSGSRPR